ncbi:MAG: HAD family hydrolase [Nanoarchaeota archaeon]|nr:HAD family hydrolase [Nanoarchaeota archaeon]
MIKAILFDVDGTLVDSSEAHVAFYQQIFQDAGYAVPAQEAIRKIFHLSMNDTLQTLALGRPLQEIKRLLDAGQKAAYPAELQKVPAHSLQVVRELSKTFSLALVTSRRRITVESYFAVAPVKSYFPVVIAVEDVVNRKPHPEPLLAAAKRLGVSSKEAVYIGDSPVDGEAAKAAGMKFIACTDIPGADAYFSSFRELPGLISQLGSKTL